MSSSNVNRHLAAILAADVAGFSMMMGKDEAGTLQRLKALRKELVQPEINDSDGRVVKLMGDGLLAEFPSVVEAVQCAVNIQRAIRVREPELPDERRIKLRIGVNLGDIILDGTDIYGDGVNVAARLEALSEPGGINVSRSVFDEVRRKLPFDFENLGETTMKNIVQPVTVYRWVETASESGPVAEEQERTDSLPEKPSIAVLPFDNMSGDAEQEYFSDGITEDIITELSRFRDLFVIARNSSFTFKGQNVDVKEVASKLGVQYVVEGSVRKVGNRVRITAQLIDAASGNHVWADRFDRTLDDIFVVQDEVVSAIVSTLPSQIKKADFARQQRRPSDVRAYDLALRAFNTMDTMEGIVNTVALLEQALAIEPDYAMVHYLLAAAYLMELDYQLLDVTGADAEKIMTHARRAVELDASDDRGFQMLSDICLFVERDLVEARIHAEHAVKLNPNSTVTVAWMGYIYNCYGETQLAKEFCERALRQDPLAPGWVKFLQGVIYFDAGQLDLALGMFLASEWDEKWPHLAAAYALSGQLDKAQQIVKRQRQAWGDINPDNLDQRIQDSLDQDGGWYTHGNKDGSFEEGIRLAGLIS